jgi:hypothetical protein
VPNGHVFIPPNALLQPDVISYHGLWQRLSTIPQARIQGRIFFRSQPFWRISTFQGFE